MQALQREGREKGGEGAGGGGGEPVRQEQPRRTVGGTHSGGGRSAVLPRGDPSGGAQPSSSCTRRSPACGAEGAGASGSVRA